MAQTPRTPVHWPRMKIRGRRNKAKTSDRRQFRTVFPHMSMTQSSPGKTSFNVIRGWQPGCVRLEVTQTTDGWGRAIGRPHLQITHVPEPRPEPTFSMSFKVENRMSGSLWDFLTGGGDRDPMVQGG